MGRNSRAKKQKRDVERRGKGTSGARSGSPSSGVKVITVSFGGEDLGDAGGASHEEDDGCPICVAMREMGIEDGQTLSDRQMERLMEAFGEAEASGAPTFRAPRGGN